MDQEQEMSLETNIIQVLFRSNLCGCNRERR